MRNFFSVLFAGNIQHSCNLLVYFYSSRKLYLQFRLSVVFFSFALIQWFTIIFLFLCSVCNCLFIIAIQASAIPLPSIFAIYFLCLYVFYHLSISLCILFFALLWVYVKIVNHLLIVSFHFIGSGKPTSFLFLFSFFLIFMHSFILYLLQTTNTAFSFQTNNKHTHIFHSFFFFHHYF